MREFGIDYFHATDLNATKKQFAGWSGSKKEEFLGKFSAIMLPMRPFGISVSADKGVYKKRKEETGRWSSLSVISNAFLATVLDVYDQYFGKYGEFRSSENKYLAVVMETGNKNSEDMAQLFEYLKNARGATALSTISFCGKKDFLAVQAADMLAYYTRRWMDDCVKRDEMQPKPKNLKIISNGHKIITFAISDYAYLGGPDGILPGDDWIRVKYPRPSST